MLPVGLWYPESSSCKFKKRFFRKTCHGTCIFDHLYESARAAHWAFVSMGSWLHHTMYIVVCQALSIMHVYHEGNGHQCKLMQLLALPTNSSLSAQTKHCNKSVEF